MKLLAALLVTLLAGCASLYPPAERALAVDAVIGDVLTTARAPVAEQRTALTRAQQLFTQSQSALDRLRLAALLAVLPPPLRDDARAAELLEPISDAGVPAIGRFAALLSVQIVERQRIARDLERAIRDNDRLAKERERTDRDRERVDKERDKREEALRQQLDALRSIERGILEREDRLRRRK